MNLILNRFATSVNELSLKLDKQGWSKLVQIVEELQDDGECLDLDISTKDAFIDSLQGNDDAIGSLFERLIDLGIGEEHRYVDSSNESYDAQIEK
jgi:hypothetical protein